MPNESINFATSYRPQTFAEVVGQDIPKTVLKKIAMADGISARSIFLKGAYGSGKSTLARIFGRALNCQQFKKTGDVCNECDHCKEVSAKNSQLYLEFDSSVVGNVDKIRELQSLLSVIPNGRRCVVFDEIHAASKAAQNAMLKMIEEGMPNTIFVFCSTDEIIPTIKSRSICLDVSTIPLELVKNRVREVAQMQNIQISDSAVDSIAMKSGGHMRDALSLLQLYSLCGEEGLKSSYGLIVKLMAQIFSGKRTESEQTLTEVMKYNMVDVKNSLYIFIKNCYTATPEDKLYKFQQSGLHSKVFNFWFNPVIQSALKDEVGLELAFRNLMDKVIK